MQTTFSPLEDGSMAAQAMTEAVKDAGIKPREYSIILMHMEQVQSLMIRARLTR